MQVYQFPDRNEWPSITKRPVLDIESLEPAVTAILNDVKVRGDRALRDYTLQFDQIALEQFAVSEEAIQAAIAKVPAPLKTAIEQAALNIEKFHNAQVQPEITVETMPGVRCWRKSIPIEKAGLYIPGGSAPLFSTVLMLGIPARIAGCNQTILCSPPGSDGNLHPAIIFAAQLVGINRIFALGGVQAIAAMSYGTETIPKVDKLFGPGNQYVTCAKQLVQKQGLAIDMPAGPSEVGIYAGEDANPVFVAADLLSQAEHGADSQVLLVTTSAKMLEAVSREITSQLETLPRKDIAQASLRNSRLIILKNEDEALELLNAYAPEHLILATSTAETLAAKVLNAGSVFLGNYSPESAGDYASGTNHTLPTNGYARSYSGVSVDSFVKKITFQQITEQGIGAIGNTIMEMAEAEGLQAHARAVAVRLDALK